MPTRSGVIKYDTGTYLITYYEYMGAGMQDDYFNCCTAIALSLSQKVNIGTNVFKNISFT